MSTEEPGRPYRRRSSGAHARPRRSLGSRIALGTVGVLGELLLTAGVFVFLYLGWQLYLNSAIAAGNQTDQAKSISESWAADYSLAPRTIDVARPDDPAGAAVVPAFSSTPINARAFATLIVPRFGADWTRPIAEGIGVDDVLNTFGIGHYPGTALPGQVGNFALAGHRTSYGDALFNINQLDVGDSIYVETADGWYRYVFRAHEYVLPDGVGVLQPVPQFPGAVPTDRVLTLTSCNPIHSVAERYIAYATFDTWTPRSEGPPAEIAHLYGAA